MVITETSREDSTWILDGEVTDRSELGEEAEDFCARYSIYRVKEMQESMKVTEIETKGKQIKNVLLVVLQLRNPIHRSRFRKQNAT